MAKSRYSALVKLKKRELDSAERDLVAANNRYSSLTTKLHNLYQELQEMVIPSRGSTGEFLYAKNLIKAHKDNIIKHQNLIQEAKIAQEKERQKYNDTHIEFEKFKYLELQEIEQKIKEQKIKESKMLDEVGVMIYKKVEK